MQWKDERDFIERTYKISTMANHLKNEVTLQVNCLLGIVVVIKQEELLEDISEEILISEEFNGSIQVSCRRNCKREYCPYNLKGFVYHLRHALAHMKIREGDPKRELKEVVFCNTFPPENPTADVKFIIKAECLPKLIEKIAKETR